MNVASFTMRGGFLPYFYRPTAVRFTAVRPNIRPNVRTNSASSNTVVNNSSSVNQNVLLSHRGNLFSTINPRATMSSQTQVSSKYSIGKKEHWKEAASLMIVAKDNNFRKDGGFDYRILFMKRQGGGNAFGGASVYPGGVVDNADFSAQWLQHFQRVGINNLQEFGWSHMEGKQRAGMIAAARDSGLLPNDVAFRICAIRETFEEGGVLLANKADVVLESMSKVKNKQFAPASVYQDLSQEDFLKWRERVYADASQFLVMCQELDVIPNLWSLFELSNSLTPRAVRRRYDTMFYVTSLDVIPDVIVDEREMENKQWLTPAEGLAMHCQGKIFLVPPQLMDCATLLDLPKLVDVQTYAADIMDCGMVPSMPVGFYLKDCLLHTLPGDSCYPENVSKASISELPKIDETEEENLRRTEHLHRITFFPDNSFTFRCSFQLPHGKRPPINIKSKEWLTNPKL